MPEPMQIQRRRTLGWKAPDNGLLTIYVGRPSIWGNPFYIVKERTRSHWDYIVRFDRLVMFDKTVSRENLGTFATKKLAQERAVELFEKWFDPTPADPGSELGISAITMDGRDSTWRVKPSTCSGTRIYPVGAVLMIRATEASFLSL